MTRWLAFTANRLLPVSRCRAEIVHRRARRCAFLALRNSLNESPCGLTDRVDDRLFSWIRHHATVSLLPIFIQSQWSLCTPACIFLFWYTSGTRSFSFTWLFVQSYPKQYRGPIFPVTNGEAKRRIPCRTRCIIDASFMVSTYPGSRAAVRLERVSSVVQCSAVELEPWLTWSSTRGPRSTYETVRNPILPSVPRHGERYGATVFPRRSCAPRFASGNRTGKGQKGPVTW